MKGVAHDVVEDNFGRYDGPSGGNRQPVRRFTLSNVNDMTVQVITYGAAITSIRVPDARNVVDDVILGFDKIEDYYAHKYYFGSTVGRFANRISGGKFSLGGRQYRLACNNGPNHLHGGLRGFDKVLWDSHVEGSTVILSYRDGEDEGYPGEVIVRVSFELTAANELVIRYLAKASKPTPINLTNHSYFNIAGHASGDIADHIVWLNADHYLPVDGDLIPSGEIASVEGTIFDLRTPTRLGDVLSKVSERGGYDHNFCVLEDSKTDDEGRRLVARVEHPGTGRRMEVLSTLPGVQFYTGGGLPTADTLLGKGNVPYRRYAGLCLETQYFPDSVNHSNFPNCIFGPGEDFEATTIYKFSTV